MIKVLRFLVPSLLIAFSSAHGYRPEFPHEPYYFQSQNKAYLAQVTPSVLWSAGKEKYLLVNKSQKIGFYKKEKPNSWKEISSFGVGKLSLISEVLVPDDGRYFVIRTDENPMVSKVSKDDAIFVFSRDGKKIKSYSHFSVFGMPGIFRNMKLELDNKSNTLRIYPRKGKPKLISLPG